MGSSTKLWVVAAALTTALAAVLSAYEVPPEVLDLDVRRHGPDGVRIEFRPSVEDAAYAIYRRTDKIAVPDDLESAIRIAVVGGEEPVRLDHPPPGLPYHYAVVAVARLERGEEQLVPGRNRTVNAVRVPLDERRAVPPAPPRTEPLALRRVPLPELLVIPELETGIDIDARLLDLGPSRPLRDDLKPAYRTLTELAPETPAAREREPEPQILRPELTTNEVETKGREATLARIVNARFQRREWGLAERELRSLYTVFERPEPQARTLFYLGQALYFQDRFHEAFMSFLLAEPELYREVQPWLNAVVRATR